MYVYLFARAAFGYQFNQSPPGVGVARPLGFCGASLIFQGS